MTPEGRVKAKVKRKLDQQFGRNCWAFMPVQNGMGAPGLDFHCCINGLAVYIETKVPGKHMTPRQQSTAATIKQAGGLVFEVCDDDSLDAAIAYIVLALRHSHIRYPEPRDTK